MDSIEVYRKFLAKYGDLFSAVRGEIIRFAVDGEPPARDWSLDSLQIRSLLNPNCIIKFRQYSIDLKAAGIFFPNPEPYGVEMWIWMISNDKSEEGLTLPVDDREVDGVSKAILGDAWSDFAHVVEIPNVPVKRVIFLVDSTGKAVDIGAEFPFDRTSLRSYPTVLSRPLTSAADRRATASVVHIPKTEGMDDERKWRVGVEIKNAPVQSGQLDVFWQLLDRLRIPGEVHRDFRPIQVVLEESQASVVYARLASGDKYIFQFNVPKINEDGVLELGEKERVIPVRNPSPGQWVAFTLEYWRELFGVGYLGQRLSG